MTGINSVVCLTDRDKKLLEALRLVRVLERDQVREIVGRKAVSLSTTNIRLKKLCDAKYLKRFFMFSEARGKKALYALGPKGTAIVGGKSQRVARKADALLSTEPFIPHLLAINAILIQLKYRTIPVPEIQLTKWTNFATPLSLAIPLVPDAYFELTSPKDIHPMFLEVDLGSESQKIWQRKTRHYLDLAVSGEFGRLFHQSRFRVLVAANSERRLQQIRKTVAAQTEKIFRFSTLANINDGGLFAAHWQLPLGEGRQALL